ncbi:MAG: class III lanthionine synthetase LanKC [Dermatophilaceae bacterium]
MREDEFLIADPVFCDTVESAQDDTAFAVCRREAPAGWVRLERGVWTGWQPRGLALPAQGWKIHVSTTPEHAEAALAKVWDYCVGAGLAFKVLRSGRIHTFLNAKGAARSSSGKLAAIYPVSDAELHAALTVLHERLAGLPGPYVLTDLRWGAGPLYVRYGAFLDQWAASPATGEPVLCMTRPDGGAEPDLRRPVFQTPSWAPVPEFIQQQIDAAADVVTGDLGYVVERALHSSNAGGVYAGRDRSGRPVVLKEARPHAGLDGHGADAVARLRREAQVLRVMSGTGVTPQLVEELTWWEHRFLVQEYVEGETLHDRIARTYPYLYPSPTPDALREYTDWATALLHRVEQALDAFHEKGLVFGDLHPANIMLADDGRVLLLDPELSFDASDTEHRVPLGDPGYRHPAMASGGRRLDDYALSCLRLAVFLPLTGMLYWDRDLSEGGKAEQLARAATERFPLPAGWDRALVSDLRRLAGLGSPAAPAATPVATLAARRSGRVLGTPRRWPWLLADTILATATPARSDRLYPGGPEGFAVSPSSVAHGAAGVLHALSQLSPDAVPAAHVAWLARSAERDRGPFTGLLDGLVGAAVVLAELGEPDRGLAVLDRASGRFGLSRGADLFGGAAGRGLGALRLHALTGSETARNIAGQAADELVSLMRATAAPVRDATAPPLAADLSDAPALAADSLVAPRGAGLMHGWSGVALFLLRLHQESGDPAYLDLALDALRRDVDRLTPAGGGLHVGDEHGRVLLYLSSGSIGVGLVVRELLGALDADGASPTGKRAAHASALRAALDGIRHTCDTEFSIMPGLFEGRAGVLAGSLLLDEGRRAARHVDDLAWHLVAHDAGLAVPGFGLIRLSMDLASGSAGVMLALHMAQSTAGSLLPALGLTPHPASVLSDQAVGRR